MYTIDYEELGLTKRPKIDYELVNQANNVFRKLQKMLIDGRAADPNQSLSSDHPLVREVKSTAGLAIVLLQNTYDELPRANLFLQYAFFLGIAGLAIIAGKHNNALTYLDIAKDCIDPSWQVDEISQAAYDRFMIMATNKEEYLG